MVGVPAFFAAPTIAWASSREAPRGFSQTTALPAWSAATAISRWPWFGVVTTTRSALPNSAFQSVALRSNPYRTWVSASRCASRPAMQESTSSMPRGRSCWLASRMARGWAIPPMKPWPMIRTLTFFIAGLLAYLCRARAALFLGAFFDEDFFDALAGDFLAGLGARLPATMAFSLSTAFLHFFVAGQASGQKQRSIVHQLWGEPECAAS